MCFIWPEVIKLEYSLKLKIKRNDWLLADTCSWVHLGRYIVRYTVGRGASRAVKHDSDDISPPQMKILNTTVIP